MRAYDKPKLEEEEIKLEDIIAISGKDGDDSDEETHSIRSVFGGRL